MDLNKILLVCAALLPAVALCIYIFKKDRVEKEPIGLLLGLLLVGVLIYFPAGEIESVVQNFINSIFTPYTIEYNGQLYLMGASYDIYNACKNFIGVALIEEGLKFLALFLITRKNKNFNSLFDGLIYAVFVSLGFAGFENVLYVVKYGWANALMRAITAVPGHMFFAVLMGYYYTLWHMHEKAKLQEKEFKKAGLIRQNAPEFSGTRYLVLSLLMPILAHGLYDYCCTSGTTISIIIFYAFIVFLYFYCFRKIRKLSKADIDDNFFSVVMILNKYPDLVEVFKQLNDQLRQNENTESNIQ